MEGWIEQFVEDHDLPAASGYKINLILEELLTNSIQHGFGDQNDGYVVVELKQIESQIQIKVKDNAAPFDPFASAPAPDISSDVEDRSVGGLGVFLVKELAKTYSYNRIDDENQIILNLEIE